MLDSDANHCASHQATLSNMAARSEAWENYGRWGLGQHGTPCLNIITKDNYTVLL